MIEELKKACELAIKRYPPKLDSGGNVIETYCNLALAEIGKALGCGEIAGKMANAIHDYALANPDKFMEVNGLGAHSAAMRGEFAFASKKAAGHGHVAAVYPEAMRFSGSLGRHVPMLANVGKKNGILKASECFPVNGGECSYFVWRNSAKA